MLDDLPDHTGNQSKTWCRETIILPGLVDIRSAGELMFTNPRVKPSKQFEEAVCCQQHPKGEL